MLFYLLLSVPVIVLAIGLSAAIYERDLEVAVFSLVPTAIIGAIPLIAALGTWAEHADDLARISSQHHIIAVQEARIESLSKRLDGFNYPKGSLLNADTPVASIVESLTDAESKLAEAKQERAKAIRSIESRRLGPMSGVIGFVGDYKVAE